MSYCLIKRRINLLTHLSVTNLVPAAERDFLAQYYQLDTAANWVLSLVNDCYCLNQTDSKLSMTLDFRCGNYRHRNQNIGKEPLLKAIKIKKKLPKTLIDTTPGVLKDSVMLAARGIQITAVERNPLLYMMVKQALRQVSLPIDYHFGDAKQYLAAYPSEIIYLDPMYPPKKNAAQVKKAMQILHQIIGADADADALLIAAKQHIQQTPSRIVVKRPNYAEPLAKLPPNFTSQTGATRFDIYLS